MRLLQPVVWSKGVFLSPQHLQAQDRFAAESLHFVTEAVSYRCWGFISLALEVAALGEGRLALARAQGIFPDGAVFDFPHSEAAPESRSLEDCFGPSTNAITVYLALPAERLGGANIAGKRGGTTSRYFSDVCLLPDDTNANIQKPVALARKNLQLLADCDASEGMVKLPIARILRTEAGHFKQDEDFIPPLIHIEGSPRLMNLLRGLIEILSTRSTQLSSGRRQRNQSLAEFSASDIAEFWLLYTTNTHLPPLLQTLRSPQVHPEALFRHLLALAGSLTTFSREVHAQNLPRYDHEHLGDCFLALESRLLCLMETVIPSRFVSFPLRPLRNSIYSTELDLEEELIEGSRFYLAVAADLPVADLVSRSSVLIKAGSSAQLEMLVRQALPGVPLTHVPEPPHEIPVRLGYQYFSLDHAGNIWNSVKRSRNFAVYVPAEIRTPQLELIVLPPAAATQQGRLNVSGITVLEQQQHKGHQNKQQNENV